jgi:hypothetical protein
MSEILKKIWHYVSLKKDPEIKIEKDDQSFINQHFDEEGREVIPENNGSYLRAMHTINRISIFMFIIGIIVVIIKIIK